MRTDREALTDGQVRLKSSLPSLCGPVAGLGQISHVTTSGSKLFLVTHETAAGLNVFLVRINTRGYKGYVRNRVSSCRTQQKYCLHGQYMCNAYPRMSNVSSFRGSTHNHIACLLKVRVSAKACIIVLKDNVKNVDMLSKHCYFTLSFENHFRTWISNLLDLSTTHYAITYNPRYLTSSKKDGYARTTNVIQQSSYVS